MSVFLQRNNRRYQAGVSILACIGLVAGIRFVFCHADLRSPLPTLIVIDVKGECICEIRDGDEKAEAGYWPVTPVPSRIAATLKVMEDRRFDSHPGVDPLAVVRAVRQNLFSGRTVSGASTLAMQVARLQKPAERTVCNKIREMMTALLLTARYGRHRIMDQYLRLAPYGNGIRGIGFAAHRYLGKPVEDLSWAEIAFLSAIPQQPNRMNPRTGSGRTRLVGRARRIIRAVRDAGYMSESEAERALVQVADIRLQPIFRQPPEAIHTAIYLKDIMRNPDRRDTLDDTIIKTGFDLSLQREIIRQAQLCVESWSASGVENAAVMVVDARTGAVVASVGSTDYFDGSRAGSIDFTRVRRSPGSTLKPFLYAFAMDLGIITPDSMIMDHVSHAGGFGNFDGVWLGEIPVRRALAASRNVPAVDLLRQSGIHRTFGHFADLRLHRYEQDPHIHGLGMAVGGLPVSMERLVQAYTVFSSRGVLRDLQWFHGQIRQAPQKIFTLDTVQWINRSLSDPMARLPSFPRMGHLEYEYPVAVKTGTSEGCRDAWTIAWSPDYMVAVWLGRPDGRPMNHAGGYRTAAVLARVIMDDLHRHRMMQAGWIGASLDTGRYAPMEQMNPVPEARLHSGAPGQHAVPAVQEKARMQPDGIRISSPEPESVYYFDPDVPAEYATIQFTAIAGCTLSSVTWEVNGIPFVTTGYPYSASWRMAPGTHRIRAVAPAENTSSAVTVIHVVSPVPVSN